MPTFSDYNRYGEEIERVLKLKTSPIAVKMLERESDIPEGALRPKKDKGYHLAQCQAFAMSRRQGATVAMLKEDHWCWAPLMAYGLVEDPHDSFVDAVSSFPRFEYGKYIGMVTAPLKTAKFEPDAVLIYSTPAQLRDLLMITKFQEKANIKSEFDPIDSCAYSTVPAIKDDQYRITIPDPGEYARAFAADDEIILSIPKSKLEGFVEGLKRMTRTRQNQDEWANVIMRPDFPRPDFYKALFKKWGLDTED